MPQYKDTHGRWRYRFAYQGHRYGGSTPRGHNTKKAAEKLERQHLEKLVSRQYTGKMPTVAEFAERFTDHQETRTKPLTQIQQKATIKTHVVPHIGKLRLDQVDVARIDGLVSLWAKNSAAKTINTRLGTLRRMLSLAAEWDIIAKVPRIRFLKIPKDTPRFLSDEEAALLVLKADPLWRSMILVALRTGLRVGELRGLQWGDVDLTRRTLQVRRTDPGRRHVGATSPKGNRERTVPLTAEATAELASIRPEKPKADEFVWPALLKRQGERRDRARSEKGCFYAVSRAAKAAGIKDCGWHTLRHTYASHLVMRGVPIRLIQQWLGHASIKETEKYSHLSPDFGSAAADALDFPLAPDRSRQHGAKHLSGNGPERNDFARLPPGD